jgi:hypothetical protein
MGSVRWSWSSAQGRGSLVKDAVVAEMGMEFLEVSFAGFWRGTVNASMG